MEIGNLIGKGRTASVYEWGENQVVKLFEPYISDDYIQIEYRKSTILQQLGIPVPFVGNILELEDKKAIVYEKLIGNTLLKTMESNPLRIKKSIEKLTELHMILATNFTNDLPDIKTLIKNSMDRIDDNILNNDKKQLIHDYIDKLPNKNSICHVDFHPDNIIMTEKGPKIIDWGNAAMGDPCADAAITTLIFTICNNPPGTSKFVDIISKCLSKRIKKMYVHKYLLLSHKTYEDIDKWMLPAAVLRLSYNLPEERNALMTIINDRLQVIN